jgi:phenylpropionate dioxygenase-like ring-hydroxylating dioxygenase large terminal subunit
MLSKEDNELVTNTDPGTPMGELFRRFWIPVALSDELPGPDCLPVKLKIMNEDLIAFRDSDGRPGLVDQFCPHRGASLYFARNEECGLRCVYHGWKFDVDGNCVDLPNTPEGDSYKNKVRITAYPCEEAGGMIFAYMGPRDKQPPFPDFDFAKVPAANIYVTKFQLECNWLQATEGDFDPSHGVFLHSTLDNNRGNPGFQRFQNRAVSNLSGRPRQNFLEGPIPEDEPFPFAVGNRRFKKDDIRARDILEDVDGAMYAISRYQRPDGAEIASINLRFQMPTYCPPGVTRPNHYSNNMRVPIDNTHMMFFRLRWSQEPISPEDIVEYKQGGYAYPEMIPGTWKTKANVFIDYEIDRLGQKTFLYSGIKTFPLQDISMMENQWGPLAKREREHLTAMDYHMIYLRRKLLKAAKSMRDGIEPKEPWIPESYHYHSASAVIENGDFEAAVAKARQRAKTSLLSATPTEISEASLITNEA